MNEILNHHTRTISSRFFLSLKIQFYLNCSLMTFIFKRFLVKYKSLYWCITTKVAKGQFMFSAIIHKRHGLCGSAAQWRPCINLLFY